MIYNKNKWNIDILKEKIKKDYKKIIKIIMGA